MTCIKGRLYIQVASDRQLVMEKLADNGESIEDKPKHWIMERIRTTINNPAAFETGVMADLERFSCMVCPETGESPVNEEFKTAIKQWFVKSIHTNTGLCSPVELLAGGLCSTLFFCKAFCDKYAPQLFSLWQSCEQSLA